MRLLVAWPHSMSIRGRMTLIFDIWRMLPNSKNGKKSNASHSLRTPTPFSTPSHDLLQLNHSCLSVARLIVANMRSYPNPFNSLAVAPPITKPQSPTPTLPQSAPPRPLSQLYSSSTQPHTAPPAPSPSGSPSRASNAHTSLPSPEPALPHQ